MDRNRVSPDDAEEPLNRSAVGKAVVPYGSHRWIFYKWCSRNKIFLSFLAAVVAYISVGLIFYTQEEGFTTLESLYFTVMVVTTVGYGHLVPTGEGAQLFTALYALFGVTLFSIGLSIQLENVVERADSISSEAGEALVAASVGRKDKIVQFLTKHHSKRTTFSFVVWYLLPFTVVIAIGVTFMVASHGYSFIESFYWAIVTGTSIGFGDINAYFTKDGERSRGGMWFGIFYMVFFVALVIRILDAGIFILRQRSQALALNDTLYESLSSETLKVLDFDGNKRVTKFEYMSGILVANGIITMDMVKAIGSRFDELDRNNDKSLNEEDLKLEFRERLATVSDVIHPSKRATSIKGPTELADICESNH